MSGQCKFSKHEKEIEVSRLPKSEEMDVSQSMRNLFAAIQVVENSNERIQSVTRSNSPTSVMDVQSGEEKDLDTLKRKYDQYERISYEDMLLIIDDEKLRNSLVCRSQSGIEGVAITTTDVKSKHQTLYFDDEHDEPKYIVKSEMEPTRMLRDMPDVSLGKFFERPIVIYQQDWQTGTAFGAVINPWFLLMNNKRIANRLANYYLFRANLHIKVVINGNGFHYGRALVAYEPLHTFASGFASYGQTDLDFCLLSQMPHLYIDPTTSTGGEMVLPFFWNQDYLNIPDNECVNMGQLHVRQLTPIKHANGGDAIAPFTIFAWFEDVQLSAPTGRVITPLPAQAGREVDMANSDGVISGPATAISRAATALSGIGAIAPYAMATAKVAKGVAGVARAFGFSAPPVTVAHTNVRLQPSGQLAMTTVPAIGDRLTVDDKQELSLDPRIASLAGDDSLNIKNIASREAFIDQFTWGTAAATDDLLWSHQVIPTAFLTTPDSGGTAIGLPPVAVAALPFEYWTGSLKFRFQIVSSSFHKGRFAIQYDPAGFPPSVLTGPFEYNTAYTRIVDISKERDVTFEIGASQPTTYMPVRAPLKDLTLADTKSGIANFGNGAIIIKVLNELTTPNVAVNNDIEINVFISAGNDFEVAVPTSEAISSYIMFPPQSGLESNSPNAIPTTEDSNPQQYLVDEFGPGEQQLSNVNKVYFGETITSFRPLLKRFEMHATLKASDVDGPANVTFIRNAFPYWRGDYNGAPNTSAIGDYAYCNTLLLHWVTMCFSGMRGSLRWKWRKDGAGANSAGATLTISRRTQPGTAYEYNTLAKTFGFNNVAYSGVRTFDPTFQPTGAQATASGSTLAAGDAVLLAEAEIPFYSNKRFQAAKRRDFVTFVPDSTFYQVDYSQTSSFGQDRFYTYVAAGEDFQLYFWTGPTRVFYEPRVEIPLPA